MHYQNALSVGAVPVSDKFIDEYMPQANGDYVKVYLWLLRKGTEEFSLGDAAGELMLTEGDVERAVRYWQEKGVLMTTGKMEEQPKEDDLRSRYFGAAGAKKLAALKNDETFKQLLIIVQTYLSRIIIDPEAEVLAYLYDGLGLPAEVIDYLVAYAVDNAGGDMRYIEKTGKDWAGNGVKDEEGAKIYIKKYRFKNKRKDYRSAQNTGRISECSEDMEELMKRLVD